MFRKLFRLFLIKESLLPLGRWSLTDMKKNKIKIDWANIDHCGTCSYEEKKKKPDVKPKLK